MTYATYGGNNATPIWSHADQHFDAEPVDGSLLLPNWQGLAGWLRSYFWQVNHKTLPLRGQVWYPQKSGRSRLVLMVHGNHAMEDFSDSGYEYIGSFLASHGYIAVSVDQNFLNSSFSDLSYPIKPGLTQENDARGWLLLKHLAQWRAWQGDDSHPLSEKIDMSKSVLIGHSRGGEAVAIAAEFNRLGHYPDNALLTFDFGFDLGGIIAIAPTDGQYQPRQSPLNLTDVNYFTIQGSSDGDMQSFKGLSTYQRATFTNQDYRFKASLYVYQANHGQFNTDWGRCDRSKISCWTIDDSEILQGSQQRSIALTYIHAFIQSVTTLNNGYLPLFSNPAYGSQWLPKTYYVANFADSTLQWLANFDEDADPATGTLSGSTIRGQNLTIWQELQIKMKWGQTASHLVKLAWDDRAYEQQAKYHIQLAASLSLNPTGKLVFSAADANGCSLPDNWSGKEPCQPNKDKVLDWSITLTDTQGQKASLPLSHDHGLYPQVEGKSRLTKFINHSAPSEPILSRYQFAITDFMTQNPELNPAAITAVSFEFNRSSAGVILLDDIAFSDK